MKGLARRAEMQKYLLSDAPFGTSLLLLGLDRFPPSSEKEDDSMLSWLPETIREEYQKELGRLAPHNFDKLMAAVTLQTTDLFRSSPARFVRLADALVGNGLQLDADLPSIPECCWAIIEASFIDPDEDNYPWHPGISRYLGFMLKQEGWLAVPPVLQGIAEWKGPPDLPREWLEPAWARHRKMEKELHEDLAENLLDLAAQLSALPIRDGDVREVVEHIESRLLKKPA